MESLCRVRVTAGVILKMNALFSNGPAARTSGDSIG
jgi:hypothetical protein